MRQKEPVHTLDYWNCKATAKEISISKNVTGKGGPQELCKLRGFDMLRLYQQIRKHGQGWAVQPANLFELAKHVDKWLTSKTFQWNRCPGMITHSQNFRKQSVKQAHKSAIIIISDFLKGIWIELQLHLWSSLGSWQWRGGNEMTWNSTHSRRGPWP